MKLRLAALIALFLTSATAVVFAGQPADAIDFRRDVQPILRARCISCHGPDLQMSGLRLDRRADAMRGGTQSDIGPGNAEGSRLFAKLISPNFGLQMPPNGSLNDSEIETIRLWIDEGAIWPDGPDSLASDTRSHGETPLMTAALHADAAGVKRLLQAGADPNATDAAGGTALIWAAPDVPTMRLLLDAGADVNARSDERRSPLVVTSGIVGAAQAVRLLLEYGADPSVWRQDETSALREAARVDDVESVRVLVDYGASPTGAGAPSATFLRTNCAKCAALFGAGGPLPKQPPEEVPGPISRFYDPLKTAHPTPVGPTPATPAAIRAAVERSLPLLQQIDVDFVKHTGCVSCHHNSVVAMAVSAARAHGYTVDEDIAKGQLKAIGGFLESWRARALQNIPIAGGADTNSYLLFGLAEEHYPSDAATEAQAIWLKRRQAADGHWPLNTIRPPIESNDIAVTALSMRALQVFGPRSQRADYANAVDRARAWLLTAPANGTEERAFRLLGLSWAGAPADAIRKAARELLATQRGDGGWTQLDEMPLADAYATGEALVALRVSGAVDPSNPAYRKGLEYLLREQIDDGTWFVETRANPIQSPFASGFPYGVHQWISAAATGWATTALALAR